MKGKTKDEVKFWLENRGYRDRGYVSTPHDGYSRSNLPYGTNLTRHFFPLSVGMGVPFFELEIHKSLNEGDYHIESGWRSVI
ncbi:MAG: hypothetical protein UZ19_OD1000040 [Parcubacteria bacterium OLB19]|nr:MAG: hypothetical protein UZ19_OD1000040 [Parcubacteria bacterium OLB19]